MHSNTTPYSLILSSCILVSESASVVRKICFGRITLCRLTSLIVTPGAQSEQSGKLRSIHCKGRGHEELCTSMSGLHLQLPVPVVAGQARSSSIRVGMLGKVVFHHSNCFYNSIVRNCVLGGYYTSPGRRQREYNRNQISLLTCSKAENCNL